MEFFQQCFEADNLNESNFVNWTRLVASACPSYWPQASTALIVPEHQRTLTVFSYASLACLLLLGLLGVSIGCCLHNPTKVTTAEDMELDEI